MGWNTHLPHRAILSRRMLYFIPTPFTPSLPPHQNHTSYRAVPLTNPVLYIVLPQLRCTDDEYIFMDPYIYARSSAADVSTSKLDIIRLLLLNIDVYMDVELVYVRGFVGGLLSGSEETSAVVNRMLDWAHINNIVLYFLIFMPDCGVPEFIKKNINKNR